MRKVELFAKVVACLSILHLVGGTAFAAKTKAEKSAQKMPEWVSQPSAVFPSADYISSVGSATSCDNAEMKALQGLASVFGQAVKSSSAASQRMTQAKAEGKVATANVSAFSQDILRTVDVDSLIGVETKEFWFDGNETWYAVAVLDKEKASDIYSDLIRKNTSAISAFVASAESNGESLEAYAALDFAEDIALENEGHLKKLSVIKPEVAAFLKDGFPSPKKLHAQKAELSKRIPICVIVEGEDGSRLASAFGEAISSLGFRGTFDSWERYVLSAQVSFERSDATDGKTTRCRYAAEGFLIDMESGQKLCPFKISGREGHVEYSEAKVRAVKAMEAKIKKDFAQTFDAYLKNFEAK